MTDTPPLLEALKKAASCLKQADVAFALGGGYAVFARGGSHSAHDVDFFVREDDVEAAVAVLADGGFLIERPPEDWLVKAWDAECLIDLIFRPSRRDVDDDMLGRATDIEVGAIVMPVLDASDLVALKLLSLSEHHCNLSPVLAMIRAVREQVDWSRVRDETADSAYARAAIFLAESLRLVPPPSEALHLAPARGSATR